jgi:hypothetical protein
MRILRLDFLPERNGISLDKIYGKDIGLLHKGILDVMSSLSGESFEVIGIESTNEFPPKEDGFVYTSEQYFNVLNGKEKGHSPDYADYKWIIDKFDLVNRKNNGEFDEVHMFGSPYLGFYESRMVGKNSIWCNAPAYKSNCENFILMGYSYEREVSEGVHDWGHRAESILYYCVPNLWKKFSESVGVIHFPHNTKDEYCYWDESLVLCYADMFPDVWDNKPVPVVSEKNKGCNLSYLALLQDQFIIYWIFSPLLEIVKVGDAMV